MHGTTVHGHIDITLKSAINKRKNGMSAAIDSCLFFPRLQLKAGSDINQQILYTIKLTPKILRLGFQTVIFVIIANEPGELALDLDVR